MPIGATRVEWPGHRQAGSPSPPLLVLPQGFPPRAPEPSLRPPQSSPGPWLHSIQVPITPSTLPPGMLPRAPGRRVPRKTPAPPTPQPPHGPWCLSLLSPRPPACSSPHIPSARRAAHFHVRSRAMELALPPCGELSSKSSERGK